MKSHPLNPNTPFSDETLARELLRSLCAHAEKLAKPLRFMEVCGTHTVSLFRSGLRGLLPKQLEHVSGPGCPVCVTHDADLALVQTIAAHPGITIATFGDMLRVPGHDGRSLKHAQAEGARIATVYSPLDALRLAERHADELVVFLSVGFETTLPAAAATILEAERRGISNFCLFNCHKSVAPALQSLLDAPGKAAINAFLLPGHVATITGLAPFGFLPTLGYPAVVAGFEPADMLAALCRVVDCAIEEKPLLLNAYPRAVNEHGNPRARKIIERVFERTDALWRGLGSVKGSGFRIRPEFKIFDVAARLDLERHDVEAAPGCRCGEILRGVDIPPSCPLFGKTCTPATPVGPCMVSTEGSCAAWHLYAMPE